MPDKNTLYPIFLKLEQLELLLIGAGNIALEKLISLLSNSPKARITIVAPEVHDEIRQLVKLHSNCTIIEREFAEQDLDNKDLVILATNNKELNAQIKSQATLKKVLANVADTPDLCDFYLGSIVQKGNLKIAISTNGKSPTIAKRVKETLSDVLPDEIDSLLENMSVIRNNMNTGFAEKVKRLNELTKSLTGKQAE